jgi:hypothetical protein
MVARPESDDVVIRERSGDDSGVHLLGTPATPDQLVLGTRDSAVSHALRYARRLRVRAWFAKPDHDFVLLGTFRQN